LCACIHLGKGYRRDLVKILANCKSLPQDMEDTLHPQKEEKEIPIPGLWSVGLGSFPITSTTYPLLFSSYPNSPLYLLKGSMAKATSVQRDHCSSSLPRLPTNCSSFCRADLHCSWGHLLSFFKSICVHMCVYSHIYIYMHIHTYMHTCMSTVLLDTHMYTHTHTPDL
jgi:hypothetical protein